MMSSAACCSQYLCINPNHGNPYHQLRHHPGPSKYIPASPSTSSLSNVTILVPHNAFQPLQPPAASAMSHAVVASPMKTDTRKVCRKSSSITDYIWLCSGQEILEAEISWLWRKFDRLILGSWK